MKTYKFALRTLILLSVLTLSFVACEQDFASIDSDIINPDTATNFETDNTPYSVITYTDALGPVQTNSQALNFLGVYNDQTFGKTTSSFVSQLSLGALDPDFGSGVVLDSVVINLPFFSRTVGVTEDGLIDYKLDSIFPNNSDDNYDPIKLSIYRNNYFLREFDPNSDFNDPQPYFSDKSLSETEMISDADLQFQLIDVIEELTFTDSPIILTDNETPSMITQTQTPAIRLVYTPNDGDSFNFWKEAILDQQGNSSLSNSNNFNNYFRGIYFKAEAIGENGAMAGLNLASENANITLYYNRDPFTAGASRENTSFTLRFSGTRINFYENEPILTLADGNENEGDARLFLKGGQGSVAGIKLFDGDSQEFQNFRETYATYDSETGDFEKYRRLINEANLIFYVDQSMINGEEPSRIYIYDMENNIPLIDYQIDATNNSIPLISKPNHLGILQRVDGDFTSAGIKYKLKITQHLKNLIETDSNNVKLGLAVSGNVNLEGVITQRDVLGEIDTNIPVSSIITPRGTILHGSNSEDVSKRVQLEIFYTCLKSDGDCQ